MLLFCCRNHLQEYGSVISLLLVCLLRQGCEGEWRDSSLTPSPGSFGGRLVTGEKQKSVAELLAQEPWNTYNTSLQQGRECGALSPPHGKEVFKKHLRWEEERRRQSFLLWENVGRISAVDFWEQNIWRSFWHPQGMQVGSVFISQMFFYFLCFPSWSIFMFSEAFVFFFLVMESNFFTLITLMQ